MLDKAGHYNFLVIVNGVVCMHVLFLYLSVASILEIPFVGLSLE